MASDSNVSVRAWPGVGAIAAERVACAGCETKNTGEIPAFARNAITPTSPSEPHTHQVELRNFTRSAAPSLALAGRALRRGRRAPGSWLFRSPRGNRE